MLHSPKIFFSEVWFSKRMVALFAFGWMLLTPYGFFALVLSFRRFNLLSVPVDLTGRGSSYENLVASVVLRLSDSLF